MEAVVSAVVRMVAAEPAAPATARAKNVVCSRKPRCCGEEKEGAADQESKKRPGHPD